MVLSYFSSYVFSTSSNNDQQQQALSNAAGARRRYASAIGPDLPPDAGPSQPRSAADSAKYDLVDQINAENNLYRVLGVSKSAKTDEMRRAYINRSRVCHPDKFPEYPASTSAFQKLSFAYETLSRDSSRRLYDISGRADWSGPGGHAAEPGRASHAGFGDETLNGVLYTMFCEFMEGDFEMIRVLVNALNEGNPGLNLGEDAIENLEGAFKRIRDLLLAGRKYLQVVKFELIRLYEIQHSLRQLSYFDVLGRIRLTMQLARVTLSIPMAIDKAMKEDSDDEGSETDTSALSEEDGESHENEKEKADAAAGGEGGGAAQDAGATGNGSANGSTNGNGTPNGTRRGKRRRKKKRRGSSTAIARRGLLGPTVTGVLELAVGVLERGERIF